MYILSLIHISPYLDIFTALPMIAHPRLTWPMWNRPFVDCTLRGRPVRSYRRSGSTTRISILISLVHVLYNRCLRLHYFTSLWKHAKLIMIPKARKIRTLPEKHRPICLLPVISKVFERLLRGRIVPLLDDFIRQEQFGFRSCLLYTSRCV